MFFNSGKNYKTFFGENLKNPDFLPSWKNKKSILKPINSLSIFLLKIVCNLGRVALEETFLFLYLYAWKQPKKVNKLK